MGLGSRKAREQAAERIEHEADKQSPERSENTRVMAEHMRAGRISSYTTADGRTIKP
jgi:hypothetical protein